MTAHPTPQVVCANDLLTGDAIWRRADGHWTGHFAQAQVLDSPEQAKAALASATAQADRIVGAYLAPVVLSDGQPRPAHFREAFRTRGPSNYFHGKQAEAQ